MKRVRLIPDSRKQPIIGFGGAFTDATGINIASLDSATQEQLLKSYFGQNGIQYSLGRVPIASTDFSPREYSYSEVDSDFELKSFALASEDYKYKIPYIKSAMAKTGGALKLFGSPWSAPGWMKTSGQMVGGILKGSNYEKSYAQYFVRFLEEYDRNGVQFWGLTAQNEPEFGLDPNTSHYQKMYFTAEAERDFIKNSLGPALQLSSLGRNVALMIFDDNRSLKSENNELLPAWVNVVLSDNLANNYTTGIAVHWYENAPFSLLTEAHNSWPNKFLLGTEASVFLPHSLSLGYWSRGDQYAHDIISNLNNWVAGWTDWNMVLDMKGGPSWVGNFADSPIRVDASKGEFYKQPMFYALGHFSKFIRPDSVRIDLSMDGDDELEGVAFSTPTKQLVLVVRNAHSNATYDLQIEDATRPGQQLHVTVDPESLTTIVWNEISVSQCARQARQLTGLVFILSSMIATRFLL